MHPRQSRARRIARIASIVIASCMSLAAHAQDKPLIEKWLDGEVKANFPAVTYNGPRIELRYATFIGEFGIDVKAFKLLEAATGGKLAVRPFWGNTLANMMRGPFEAVSGGVADFGNCYVSNSPGGFTLHHLLNTPFLFESSQQGSWMYTELYPRFFKKDYEAKGVYMIRTGTTRPSQIMSRNAAIEKLEDLKGKKIWSLGSPYVNDMMKALGAAPTFIAIPEVYTALQSGVLDGVANHDAGFTLFKWNEVGKFHTRADLWANPTEYCLNKAKFDGLPKDLKGVFYHWAQLVTQAYAERYYDFESNRAIDDMKKRGLQMHTLSADERKRWSAATQPVTDALVKQYGQQAADLMTAMRSTAEKYSKLSPDQITQQVLDKPVPGLIDF
jgi:TRAP-type transport system periplasmic protein